MADFWDEMANMGYGDGNLWRVNNDPSRPSAGSVRPLPTNIVVKPEQAGTAIRAVLQTFDHSVVTALDEAAQTTGKEVAKYLRGISPVKKAGINSGRYARGWTSKRQKNGTVYVYNKTDYNLTHLLENGHRIVSHGKDTGKKTRAFPHIKYAQEYAETYFENALRLKIQH